MSNALDIYEMVVDNHIKYKDLVFFSAKQSVYRDNWIGKR